MAKTQSQTEKIVIKKEEEDIKDIQLLHSVNNTTGNSGKITKRKASKSKGNLLPTQEIKVEENTDVKSLLRISPTRSTLVKSQCISQEQIKQLIHYIVSDKMAISTAAYKLKINFKTASYYYNVYKNDPEKKIPMPLEALKGNKYACTQEQITKLIKHIVDDGMTILAASTLAGMNNATGHNYYRKYMEDPNHNIPMQGIHKSKREHIKSLIGYIVDDKMSITAASKKANMDYQTGKKYYQQYLEDPNHDIPVGVFGGRCGPNCTQDQVNRLISFIIDDKMTVADAAKKANMDDCVGRKYYQIYKMDPNHRIPVVGPRNGVPNRAIPQDKIKALISYITEDKMSIKAASRKAKIGIDSGRKYYHKYRNDAYFNNINTSNQSAVFPGCTQEQMKELTSFIIDDKMTVKDASEKANMSPETGEKCYQQYLSDLHHDVPTHIVSRRRCTEEQINTLVKCVIDDKMTLTAASKKANMNYRTGSKYFRKYVNDLKINAPILDHEFRNRPCTLEQMNTLVRCIVDDNMTVVAALKKANMGANTGHQYVNDPNNGASTHIGRYPNCTQEQVTDLIRYISVDKMSMEGASKKANMTTITGHIYYMRHLQNHD